MGLVELVVEDASHLHDAVNRVSVTQFAATTRTITKPLDQVEAGKE